MGDPATTLLDQLKKLGFGYAIGVGAGGFFYYWTKVTYDHDIDWVPFVITGGALGFGFSSLILKLFAYFFKPFEQRIIFERKKKKWKECRDYKLLPEEIIEHYMQVNEIEYATEKSIEDISATVIRLLSPSRASSVKNLEQLPEIEEEEEDNTSMGSNGKKIEIKSQK